MLRKYLFTPIPQVRYILSNSNDLKSILKNQILNPVLFKNQIENIYDAGGRIFIEFGPKGILTNLVSNILEGKEHHAIALNAIC